MDFILSIPIVSYLTASSATSLSTSMNLLFFYMTWTTLLFSHPPLQIHLSGVLVTRVIFWLLPSLVFLLFDTLLPSVAAPIKHGGQRSLPPRNRLLGRQLLLALLNLAVLIGVEGCVSSLYLILTKRTVFRMSTALPFPWTVFKHVFVVLTAREFLQYYIHRHILHGDNWLGKRHVSYVHGTAGASYSLQLLTDHPACAVLHRLLPVFIPAALLRPHVLAYFLIMIFVSVEETMSMSGYTVVPGILMRGITQRSAIHYAGKGSSNFGAWGVLDWAHGTSKGRDVFADLHGEAEKHHVKERGAEKVDEGTSVLQSGLDSLKKGASKRKTRKE